MNDDRIPLQSVCTKNRAEELGLDVWREFVVPLFFDELDIANAAKPRVVVGGRGCGKTMLLRYLSHHSTFSPDRASIHESDLRHLGLYWKVDTHFLGMLAERGIEDHIWESAFGHLLAIVVCTEIIWCLENIAKREVAGLTNDRLVTLDAPSLRGYDAAISGSLPLILEALKRRKREFEAWVNNPRKLPEPIFLPGKEVILALIEDMQRHVLAIRGSTFFLYIDEYENLRDYQQRIVNTYLKHSEPPLIFNLATKRYGMKTRRTVGDESITDIADYRTHDLDDYLRESNFKLFAAEILFLRFATMAQAQVVPVNIDVLRSPEELPRRRSPGYVASVIAASEAIFPGLSQSELAKMAITDNAILRKLDANIGALLKSRRSMLDPRKFIRPGFPEATIIVPALLARRRNTAEGVLREFDALEAGHSNRFTGKTDWIHNNFIGCLLQLYAPYNRACPFYAGFDTFVQLSALNLRYFLELCHKSLKRATPASGLNSLRVPAEPSDTNNVIAVHTCDYRNGFWRRSARHRERRQPRPYPTIETGDLLVKRVGRDCSRSFGRSVRLVGTPCTDCVLLLKPIDRRCSTRLLFAIRCFAGIEWVCALLERGTGAAYIASDSLADIMIPSDLSERYPRLFSEYASAIAARAFSVMTRVESQVRSYMTRSHDAFNREVM